MDGLFGKPSTLATSFCGFGPSVYADVRQPGHPLDVSSDPKTVRKQLRADCPALPGVYGMIDATDQLIYVGMSIRLRDRLLTYFTKGPPAAKEQRIAGRTVRLVWEVGDHELLVQLRELELIRRWRPRFNSRGRPGRRQIGYVYLTNHDAPNFRTGARPRKSCRHWWGPLILNRRTRIAVNRLNHLHLLRDCPTNTPIYYVEQRRLLPDEPRPKCIRSQMQTCLAPCGGKRSRREYAESIVAARMLLDGRDRKILDQLESAMYEASAKQQYEQASILRDTWQQLCSLCDQLEMLRTACRDYWFVYPVQGSTGRRCWIVVAAGVVVKVLSEPDTTASSQSCLGLLNALRMDHAHPEPENFDQVKLVASWFRQHPHEMRHVLRATEDTSSCRKRIDAAGRNDTSATAPLE